MLTPYYSEDEAYLILSRYHTIVFPIPLNPKQARAILYGNQFYIYHLIQWHQNAQQMDFIMLRNSQGIHAPLRLQMERSTAAKVLDIISDTICLISVHVYLVSMKKISTTKLQSQVSALLHVDHNGFSPKTRNSV